MNGTMILAFLAVAVLLWWMFRSDDPKPSPSPSQSLKGKQSSLPGLQDCAVHAPPGTILHTASWCGACTAQKELLKQEKVCGVEVRTDDPASAANPNIKAWPTWQVGDVFKAGLRRAEQIKDLA